MNNGLLQILIEEDSGYKKEGNNWGRSLEHSSLVVNEESQRWYWNSEDMGGTALDYLIKVRGVNKKTAEIIVNSRNKVLIGSYGEEEEKTYSPHEPLVDLLWQLGKGNRQYWYERKLTDRTIDRYRLGFYDGWYLIPLYVGNTFVNFQKRRDLPNKAIKLWYRIAEWKPVLINPDILSLVDTVFMTEGPVDAISHTGGAGFWNPQWIEHFQRVKTVYYIADNDEAGMNGAFRVAKGLGMDKVRVFQFSDKFEKYDTGDYFKEGGTAKEFRQLVEEKAQNLFEIGAVYGNNRKGKYNRNALAYNGRG
jgi:hypothetical protein